MKFTQDVILSRICRWVRAFLISRDFWTVEFTKACCFVFSSWKKVQQKGLKFKKLLGSFMSRILRFSFIYAWYCISCASVKKKQQIGSNWTLPGNWICGKRREWEWLVSFLFTFSRIFICKKSVKTSEICFASFCRQVSESGRNTWEFHPLTSLLLRCRIHHSN